MPDAFVLMALVGHPWNPFKTTFFRDFIRQEFRKEDRV